MAGPKPRRMLHGIETLPRRPVFHRGKVIYEMDLDGLLARRPQLALIDELAHSNAPDSRHEKRWQDVEEVLAAGIDVHSTLNIQHIETLNDPVARITGIRVRETVPDHVLAGADEIELVDLPPDDLMARLREGKVYVPEQAARAAQNFFVKGNLTALRELALRAAADRVDAELREHMAQNAIPGPWPAQERILCCIDDSPTARDAIRAAKRAADRARSDWIALHVTSTRAEDLPDEAKDRLAQSLRLAERLGAEVHSIQPESRVAAEILAFARRSNVRRIVLGRPRPRGWLGRLGARIGNETVAADVIAGGAAFEVMLVAEDGPRPRRVAPGWRPGIGPGLAPWFAAAAAILVATVLAAIVDAAFPVASLSLIYMTAVIVTATRFGLWPSILAAGLGFLSYNFFFTVPRHTFFVVQEHEVLTLGLFLAASILTGNLAGRLRQREISQRAIADRTSNLYDFSRRVAAAASFDDVVWAAVSHVAMTLECQSVLLVPEPSGQLAIAGAFPPEDRLGYREMSAAQYAWEREEPAGRGSATLPASAWLFLAVRTGERKLGVLGIAWEDARSLSPGDRRLVDALVDQIALALERTRLSEDLARARVASEAERLRGALLSSVSHDLRTPLVSIIGAATTLVETEGLPVSDRRMLAETIREEGERLDRYIQNLLDMTRLGHGALAPKRVASDLAELVGSARQRLRGVLAGHPVEVEVPALPPMLCDPILIEQVIVNILDNAAKYAPPQTAIRISGRVDGPRIELAIADRGAGIPVDAREKVFDMFYRVQNGDRQRAGTGLGLAICRGLVEANGGSIRAEAADADGTGTRIVVALPLANPEAPE